MFYLLRAFVNSEIILVSLVNLIETLYFIMINMTKHGLAVTFHCVLWMHHFLFIICLFHDHLKISLFFPYLDCSCFVSVLERIVRRLEREIFFLEDVLHRFHQQCR